MILITLGTQDKSFERLLKVFEKALEKGTIKDKVVVQAGHTKFESKHMEIFDYIPMNKFESLIKSCDTLVTHGGVGSIVAGLNNGKKVMAVARLKEYNEHTNNHQLEIVEAFSKAGYIINVEDLDNIEKYFDMLDNFQPKKYNSNQESFIVKLDNKLQSLL